MATPMVAALEVASVPAAAEAWVVASAPLEAALPASSTLLAHPPVGRATSTEILAGLSVPPSLAPLMCTIVLRLLLFSWFQLLLLSERELKWLRACNSHLSIPASAECLSLTVRCQTLFYIIK